MGSEMCIRDRYRAVAWKTLYDEVPLEDEDAVTRLAKRAVIELTPSAVLIDGHDVTRDIRTPSIDRAATSVARLPGVRAVLVERQRALAANGAIVMEGRDIGTVVFPNADVKVYLDASPEERARRRANDPAHSGGSAMVAEVATAMTARDEMDKTRTASPLYNAPDAVVIDTTAKDVQQVVAEVLALIGERPARS